MVYFAQQRHPERYLWCCHDWVLANGYGRTNPHVRRKDRRSHNGGANNLAIYIANIRGSYSSKWTCRANIKVHHLLIRQLVRKWHKFNSRQADGLLDRNGS